MKKSTIELLMGTLLGDSHISKVGKVGKLGKVGILHIILELNL